MRGKVVIIPDERQILADSFERDVYYGEDPCRGLSGVF